MANEEEFKKLEDAWYEAEGKISTLEAENAALTAQKNGLHDEVQFMRKAAKENRERAEALETQLAAAKKALENIAEDKDAPFRISVHARAALEANASPLGEQSE